MKVKERDWGSFANFLLTAPKQEPKREQALGVAFIPNPIRKVPFLYGSVYGSVYSFRIMSNWVVSRVVNR